ncbi:dienelactone hydrolase family protein [Phenylobacterium montanum]|uniref:Dienelactone hydrolase family protein n=1 Tax=Phenylobacterium montanum TaxID=2823693 RepID=A0A975FZL3_9CAUL|nr:dienelactone hydrolase family protein [Caulobacter sp. S6]QUD87251.1 dienelactone hydrolase family protein [Caulobacter sp. S6]
MADRIKIKSADGFEFEALHATPSGKRRGGVIVIQEIFGLDQYVQADVARWAGLGFEAVAPSMYDRVEPGFTAGHDEQGLAAAFATVQKAKPADALADIAACIAFLKDRGPVFIVGYCYGGTMVWHASANLDGLAAGSSYYGGGVAAAADLKLKNPVICHFGRKDGHIPADEVTAKIKAAHPDLPVYIYEKSGHGFNNDGRPDSDPDDAKTARERTLALFEANGAL